MKVLFITNMYPVEDYIYFGIHVKEQIEALAKYENVESQVYFINGRESKFNYFKSIFEIKDLVRTGAFDLIHIHYGISGLFLLFSDIKIPVVMTLHSGELYRKKGYFNHLAQKKLTLSVLEKVDEIIVLNDDMIMLLKEKFSHLTKIPCGTNLDLFKPEDIRDRGNLRIGFPGNKARPEKNFELFEKILKLLGSEFKVEVVEFHNLTRDEVIRNLNNIDLLLMTSTVEGSPQIVKEAMACNKPVISTQVGDVSDLLQSVENCKVLNSFEPESFVFEIKKILSLPLDDRKSNGRQKLKDMFLDAKSVARRVNEVYNRLS